MKHYVLIKFNPGFYTEKLLDYIREVFKKIEKLENIYQCQIHTNCIARDINMDLMIEIHLKDEDALKSYLENDLHVEFAETMKAFVEKKVSFDCM